MTQIANLALKALEILTVAVLTVMSLLVIVNIALRFAFDSGIVISEELSRFLFIWLVFLGSIIAMREDGHIYVDFIRRALPGRLQELLKLFCQCAMLYCCYLLCAGSYELYEFNMEDLSPVAGIPLGYVYIAGSVGALGMGIILAVKLARTLKSAFAGAEEG